MARDSCWPRTCGMMVSLFLSTCSPTSAMWTPSMVIRPSAPSMIRNNARVNDDFPAPVRPTTPIYKARRAILSSVWHLNFLFVLYRLCRVSFVFIVYLSLEDTIDKISMLDECLIAGKQGCYVFLKTMYDVALNLPFDIVLFTI